MRQSPGPPRRLATHAQRGPRRLPRTRKRVVTHGSHGPAAKARVRLLQYTLQPESDAVRPAPHTRPSVSSHARTACSLGVGLSLCACGTSESADDEFSADAPVVIATTPRDGDLQVDPELVQITATFNEAMDHSGWSWVTEVGRETPSITGLPFYADELTTVLPVRLDPATTYVLWVNSPDDADLRKFTNLDGVSARAHRIGFTTRDAE